LQELNHLAAAVGQQLVQHHNPMADLKKGIRAIACSKDQRARRELEIATCGSAICILGDAGSQGIAERKRQRMSSGSSPHGPIRD
jgi:hypothetical protein